ncbi:MAG TPA: diphosphomevalonate decarboxylase [Polyangiaceae bacterium]|jgi:diphosphomevalonate decarboxylase
MSRAVAIAHPNVALAKYWGKRARPGNFPAVPSLSVTLAGLATRTSVAFDGALAADEIVIGGEPVSEADRTRVTAVLDRIRRAARETRRARVESVNDFPTASGLASSASGYAALAVAAAAAAKLDASSEMLSDVARRGSASAARSLFGGWVELEAGAPSGDEEDVLAARCVAPEDALDALVLVCVVTDAKKDASSRDGMAESARKSPYWDAWLASAPRNFAEMKSALEARDLRRVGELGEASALAMHAVAMAAGVVYVRGTTLELMARVRSLRADGAAAYATSDAGPHVKVLVASADAPAVRAVLEAMPGVLRVIEARPGPGAVVVEKS